MRAAHAAGGRKCRNVCLRALFSPISPIRVPSVRPTAAAKQQHDFHRGHENTQHAHLLPVLFLTSSEPGVYRHKLPPDPAKFRGIHIRTSYVIRYGKKDTYTADCTHSKRAEGSRRRRSQVVPPARDGVHRCSAATPRRS